MAAALVQADPSQDTQPSSATAEAGSVPQLGEHGTQLLETPADDHAFSWSRANETNAWAAADPARPDARAM